MHEMGGRDDPAAEGLPDALVSQADAEDGDLSGQAGDGGQAHPPVLGSSRTR